MSQNRILRSKNYSNFKPACRAMIFSFKSCHNWFPQEDFTFGHSFKS